MTRCRIKILVTLVVILPSMTWWTSLRYQMSSTNLWTRTCAASTGAVLAEVIQSFACLLLNELIMLWCWIIALPNRRNEAGGSMWAYSVMVDDTSSSVINLDNSRFVLLSNVWILIIVWLLTHFIPFLILRTLFDTRSATSRSSHGVAFFVTGPLAVITFLFNHKLVLLSVAFVAIQLHLDLSIIIILVGKLRMVIEASKFLFTLVRC